MALLALSILAPAASHAQGAALDPDDALLFDIRADGLRLGDGVHGYRIGEETCIDLADFSRAVDLAITIDQPRQVAQGWAFSERNLISIDRTRGRTTVNGHVQPFAAGAIRNANKGWCVATTALAAWLGLQLDVDLLESTIAVSSTDPLPAVAAARRAARAETQSEISDISRKAISGPPVETIRLPYKAWRTPSIDVTGSVTTANGKLGGDYEMFGAGEIAWLSADGRFASDPSGVPQSVRLRFYREDPDAQLLGRLQATEAAIGDVASQATTLAVRGVNGRGGTISNRPLGQATQFDRTDLVGDAPVGWDVELYRNGELSGLAKPSPDGRYAFRQVQLIYGSNRLEIVKYGPQGQVRRERRVYEVGRSAVPPGTAWWWANAVDENRDLVGFAPPRSGASGWRFGAGVDYGLDLRTSASLSAHSLMRDGRRLRLAETEVRRGFGPFAVALGSALDTRGGHAFSLAALGRVGETAVSARLLHNSALRSEVIEGNLATKAQLGVDQPVRIGKLMLPVHFDLAHLANVGGRRQLDAGMRLSATVRRLSVTFSTALNRVAEPGRAYGPVAGTAAMLVSGRVRGVTVRGEVNYELGAGGGLANARIGGEGSWSSADSWQAAIGYDWSGRDLSLSAAYSRHFKSFTLSSALTGTRKSGISGRLGILFSIGPDGRGRFGRMSSARLASSGAVAVHVLRDGGAISENSANAVTPLASRVRLKIGDQPAKAESNEWIAGAPIVLAALAPAAPILVGVDPSSLNDPLLSPAERAVRVIPRKGLVLALNLRVAATGVIEGRLKHADGSDAAGESINLIDGNGRPVASAITEFDGGFLFEKVQYGRYRLALGTAKGLVPLRPEDPPIVINAQTPTHRLRASLPPTNAMTIAMTGP